MRKYSIISIAAAVAITSAFFQTANAQNPSPYWSLAGNSNTTAASKLGTTTATPLNLVTNNQTRLLIGADGRIGIGTNAPLAPLHVAGFGSFGNRTTAANATRTLNLVDTGAVLRVLRVHERFAPAVELISRRSADGANVAYWDLYAEPTDASFRIRDRQTGSNLDWLTISHTTGNVGIGITSPAQKLDVAGNINLAKGFGLYMENHPVFALDSFKGTVFLGNGAGAQNKATYNTGIGYHAFLNNTTGFYNTATGTFALLSNTTGSENVANGAYTLVKNTTGSRNTAIGANALYNNTLTDGNVAIGANALFANENGYYNVAVGNESLYHNFSGSHNTAIGNLAMYVNETGRFNTATGELALYFNKSGEYNSALGNYTMFSNTSGINNTAMGFKSLEKNTEGSYNTAIGSNALNFIQTEISNTAVGHSAGSNGIPGSYNTFIGQFSNALVDGLSNTVALGHASFVSANNQVRIGNSSSTSIGGFAEWTSLSDGRVKRNLRENVPGLSFINKLRPVTYNLNLDAADEIMGITALRKAQAALLPKEATQQELAFRQAKQKLVYTGFVAQDVEKAAKELGYDFSGVDAAKNEKDLYGLRYAEFVVPLVKAVQELSKENEELKSRIERLETILGKRGSHENTVLVSKLPVADEGAILQQNTPNPTNGITRISYTLPKATTRAQLVLTDNSGNTVRTISLAKSGVAEINTAGLSSGIYHYSIVADGRIIQTKNLEVVR